MIFLIFLLSADNSAPSTFFSEGTHLQCEYNVNPKIQPNQYQMDSKYYICNQLIQQPCASGSLSKIPKFEEGSNFTQAGCQFYDLETIKKQCSASHRDLTPDNVLYATSDSNFFSSYTESPSTNFYNNISAADLSSFCNDSTKTKILILENDSVGLKKLFSSLPADFYNSPQYSFAKISLNDLQKPPLKISFTRIGSGAFILSPNSACNLNTSTWAAYNRMDTSTPLKNGSTTISTQDIQSPEDFLKLASFEDSRRKIPVNSHCFNRITVNNVSQEVAVFFPLGRFETRDEASKYVNICSNTQFPSIIPKEVTTNTVRGNTISTTPSANSAVSLPPQKKKPFETINKIFGAKPKTDDVYDTPPLEKKDSSNKKSFGVKTQDFIQFIKNIFSTTDKE